MFNRYDSSINIRYDNRNQRNVALAELIRQKAPDCSKILNIGSGGQSFLKSALPGAEIFDIDIVGEADLIVDLETVKKFNFADNSFDLVVALDVLEHRDNFHLILDEALRCSSKKCIFSLPNPVRLFGRVILNKRRKDSEKSTCGVYEKFYGLPLEKPQDRHKWFFAIDDVIDLFEHYLITGKIKNVTFFSTHKWSLRKIFLRALIGRRLYRNLFLPNIWISVDF